MVPLAVSVYILMLLIRRVGGISQPIICVILGSIPGLGLMVTLAILLLVGVLVSYTVGKKTAELVDEVYRRIPLSRSIYSITKNTSDTFLSENRDLGMREMVKFSPDVYALGSWHVDLLLEAEAATSFKLLNLFVPTSPNPATANRFMVLGGANSASRYERKQRDGVHTIGRFQWNEGT